MSGPERADGGVRLHVAPAAADDDGAPAPPPGPPGRRRLTAIVVIVAAVSVVVGLVVGSALLPEAPAPGPESATPGGTAGARPGLTREQAVPPGAGRVDSVVPGGRTWYVSADGATGADGSQDRPFGAIDLAVATARAGDTVFVGPGTYPGFTTARSGRPDAPVRIVGSAAVIRGDGDGRLVEVNHDHVTVEGFEIARADILVWVHQATGVRIINNVLRDAAGECVRVKYFSSGNEVAGNRIERCGRDFDAGDHQKNGEGVYIGTSPEQTSRNPTSEPDASNDNWIHDNVVTSPAECVDIKEGASGNLVENNVCTGGQDPDGAGFSARGNGNVFRANTSSGHKGAGIRLGGDRDTDGLDNVVLGNRFTGNEGYGVKIQREPQRQICGNEVADNDERPSNTGADPTAPC
jgi:hypothetical protein